MRLRTPKTRALRALYDEGAEAAHDGAECPYDPARRPGDDARAHFWRQGREDEMIRIDVKRLV